MSGRHYTEQSIGKFFTEAHEPVWTPPVKVQHKTLPGWFPTRKCAHGKIRFRSPLMADALMHYDVDPQVAKIASYPIKLTYASAARGGARKHEFSPDLAILMKDGSVTLLSFERYLTVKSRRWMKARTEYLKEFFSLHYGCEYELLDERTIHQQPLFNNVITMWSHRRMQHGNVPLGAFRQALRAMPMPSTIGQLMDDVWLQSKNGRFAGKAYPSREKVPTFSAIMQLVISGELDVPLDQPFSRRTPVFRMFGE